MQIVLELPLFNLLKSASFALDGARILSISKTRYLRINILTK